MKKVCITKFRWTGSINRILSDDIHIPTLTVEQTLEFALSTKTPGKRVPGMTGKEFNKEVLETLLKMLNITHTKKTMVGNEFIRGVSGGERKRVGVMFL
jgi:ATP-binding cassette, subfamily G (WHITE), member 2, SNQ2